MTRCTYWPCTLLQIIGTLLTLLGDTLQFLRICLRSPTALAAENLFLRKQLALYQERHVTPRRATDATRLALTWLGRWFDWRQALVIVQPATLLRWHRQRGRPHISLGPGIPQPPPHLPVPLHVHRHQLPNHLWVVTQPILGGLHHEYRLAQVA